MVSVNVGDHSAGIRGARHGLCGYCHQLLYTVPANNIPVTEHHLQTG